MTVAMSCDHHDETGIIPSTRSRKRMLEQLRFAEDLADAFLEMCGGSELHVSLKTPDGHLKVDPTVTISLERFQNTWQAYMRYWTNAPTGDDWQPAFDLPASTRIPDLDSDAAVE